MCNILCCDLYIKLNTMASNAALLDAKMLSKLLACSEEEAELLLKGSEHSLVNAINLAKTSKQDQGDTLQTYELQSNAAAISGFSAKMECTKTSIFNPIASTSFANPIPKSMIAPIDTSISDMHLPVYAPTHNLDLATQISTTSFHETSMNNGSMSDQAYPESNDRLSLGSVEENASTHTFALPTTSKLGIIGSEYPLDELCVETYQEEVEDDDTSEFGPWLPLSRNVFEEQPYRKKVATCSRVYEKKSSCLSPCKVVKNKMKNRVELLLWNAYHINQDEIFLLNIMYPDGMVLPVRVSSESTIGQLIAYIEKTEPTLLYDAYEVVTYNPDQNLSDMPQTLTIREAGLQNKMVVFVVFM